MSSTDCTWIPASVPYIVIVGNTVYKYVAVDKVAVGGCSGSVQEQHSWGRGGRAGAGHRVNRSEQGKELGS